jgi:hypothetical protein
MKPETTKDKPYSAMTDDELRAELTKWEKRVENAGGWPSAYFAAQQVKQIVELGNQRGLGFVNRYPIEVGA